MSDIEIIGGEEHPPTASVKLHGPPGTGKTTQTMERLQSLLREYGFSVADIAFVTYRRAMAERFLERLHDADLISYEARQEPWMHSCRYIGTLHAVCNRLTDLETPASDGRKLGSIMHAFCEDEFGVPYYRAEEDIGQSPGQLMFGARSFVIENMLDCSEWHKAPQYGSLSEVWQYHPELTEFDARWEDWKRKEEIADFEDMLRTVYEEGITPPRSILAIDEYHDFTPLQDAICRHWMDDAGIIIVNGDPLQVVYSYKGATPEFYLDIELPEVLLPQSYRVPRNVWEFAGRALRPEHDPPEIEPKTEAIDPEHWRGTVLDVQSAPLGEDTVPTASGSTPGDFVDLYGDEIMFLTRTRSQERDVGRALKEAGVIFASQEGGGGWNHASKRRSLYNVLAGLRGVAPPTAFGGQQRLGSRDWGAGKPADNVWFYGDEFATFIDRVPAEYLRKHRKPKIERKVKAETRITGEEFGQYLTPDFWPLFTQGADAVEHLLSYRDKPVIAKALRRYDGGPIRGRYQTQVQTIHASKGGEAPTVVLYDGIPDRVSSSVRRHPEEAKNEARLWYVGSTRASERLVVARNGWDWIHRYLPEIEASEAAERALSGASND